LNKLVYLKCSGKPFRRKGEKDREMGKTVGIGCYPFSLFTSPFPLAGFHALNFTGSVVFQQKYKRPKKFSRPLS
jgi:hypothetical protein